MSAMQRGSLEVRQPTLYSPMFWRWLVALLFVAGDAPCSLGGPPVPPPQVEYQGRKIAQTMHYFGAPWLVRESREREEECSALLRELRLEPGQVICDMGCGNGFYALPIAKQVGPAGRVLAVDIQAEMLRMLTARAAEQEINNIQPILGTFWDPKLPKRSVDLVLMVDVYHEFSYPEAMLIKIRRSLKPTGVVALAEFRTEDPDVPIKPLHKMSKAQIMKEFPLNGFKLVREFDALPWQHLMFFARSDSPLPKIDWRPAVGPASGVPADAATNGNRFQNRP